MFDETRIQRDREICEKATPGPWDIIVNGNTVKSHAVIAFGAIGTGSAKIASGISPRTSNAAFIALSRTELPAALDEIARLQNELAEYADIGTPEEISMERAVLQTSIEMLQGQLAESQKRELAAVEKLRQVQHDIDGAECRDDLDGIKGYIDEEIISAFTRGPQD